MASLYSHESTSAAEPRPCGALSSPAPLDATLPIFAPTEPFNLPERSTDRPATKPQGGEWVEMRFISSIDFVREEIEYGFLVVRVPPTTTMC